MNFTDYLAQKVRESSPYVSNLIYDEHNREEHCVELIASENYPSEAVRAALATPFCMKYTEGYPSKEAIEEFQKDFPDYIHTGNTGRYYGRTKFFDLLELYCRYMWQQVFHTDYHVNVQSHSGSSANMEAYAAVLEPGDTILSMSLANRGHLTHRAPVNFSGKLYNMVFYGVDADGFIDYNDIYNKILEHKPKMVIVGASAYSRTIHYDQIREIIDKAGEQIGFTPYMFVDMAHVAGLIAGGVHPSPFGYADIVNSTTQKSLRGNRGGLIFCKPELAKKVDSAVFPYAQGGSLMNEIAGKAVTAEEALRPEFKTYAQMVVANAKAMAEEFVKMGYDVVTGGTDNHMFLLDFSKTHPNLTGKMVQDELDKHGITLNKNSVPNEKRSPMQTSGVRIGTPAQTTLGYGPDDFIKVAHMIDEIIENMK